ncbi:hypothetical protein Q9189_006757, partial [Teloschistes chrysophthalmus]
MDEMDELFSEDPSNVSMKSHEPTSSQEVQVAFCHTSSTTPIFNLAPELLLLLPQHLDNIEDFMNLSSTCRQFRTVGLSTSGRTILRLAAASSRTFFGPDPHFLIAATVRQVSDWALLNLENREALRQAMQEGVCGLLALCMEKAQLTMDDIRRLHASRFSLINPVSDMIDRCAGWTGDQIPNFWHDDGSNLSAVLIEPTRSLFQIVIYGELFASSMRAFIEPSSNLPWFDHDFRMDYIKYCIPDPLCHSYKLSGFEMTVIPIGPYADQPEGNGWMPGNRTDQVGLHYLLPSDTWQEAWARALGAIGPDFEEEWRQRMCRSAVQLQGLEGPEMLQPGGLEKWRPKLEAMRSSIERLQDADKPEAFEMPKLLDAPIISECPDMTHEIALAMYGAYIEWGRGYNPAPVQGLTESS